MLILDNELHGETVANRIPKVAAARGVMVDEFADNLYVENVRGHLRDLFSLGEYFKSVEPGRFRVVILDAFYRFLPKDTDENDNGGIAALYNYIDLLADRLGCCFVLIHHSSKGSQSEKSVVDVGSGAGSQSRAADCHLILRQHEENGVVVLESAVRSWAPIEATCLRWNFPLWHPADDLDPTNLRRPGKRAARKEDSVGDVVAAPIHWTPAMFVQTFVAAAPRTEAVILTAAMAAEVAERRARMLLKAAADTGLIYRWSESDRKKPIRFSTDQQPLIEPVEVTNE